MNLHYTISSLIFLVFLSCTAQQSETFTDWTTTGGNNQRTSHVDGVVMKNKPTFVTKKRISSSTPFATVNGILYFRDESLQLHAFDLEKETTLWKTTIEYPAQYLTIDDNNIYLAGYKDFKSTVTAIDLDTQQEIWQVKDIVGNFTGITIVNDILVISGHTFMAVDITTGKKIWKFDIEGTQHELKILPTTNFSGNIIYVGVNNNDLFALEVETGKILWRVKKSIKDYPIIQSNNLFVITDDYYLYKLDANNGDEVWKYKLDDNPTIWSKPTITDEILYIFVNGSQLHAVNLETGQSQWKKDFEEPFFVTHINIIATDNALIFPITSSFSPEEHLGIMNALDLKSGEHMWKKDIHMRLSPMIAITGNYIFHTGREGDFGEENEVHYLYIFKQ